MREVIFSNFIIENSEKLFMKNVDYIYMKFGLTSR